MAGFRLVHIPLLAGLLSGGLPAHAGGEPPSHARAFELAFQNGWRVPLDDSLPGEAPRIVSLGFRVFDGGRLKLPSGRIKACDPFVGMAHAPFRTEVPKGEFPVRLALLDGIIGSGRVAFARVDFATAPVARWELAVVEGQDASKLGMGEQFGYPVDAGTGSFVDAETAAVAIARMKADESWPQSWIAAGRPSDRPKGAPNYFLTVDAGPGNIVMFESGWGDGVYASWFGYDADGGLIALVTDFESVDWSKARLPEPPRE